MLIASSAAAANEPVSGAVKLARQLLEVPEHQLNIGDAALRLSALVDADADSAEGRAALDRLAVRVAGLVGARTDPNFRIRAINTDLFREEKFEYDKSDMMGLNPAHATLWGILSSRKGNCVSMPLLWFAVAERLKYPVFAVHAPQHFFLRYDDGSFRRNVEATSGGGSPTDERIIQELEIPQSAVASGSMMRSLSKRALLLELIAEAGSMQLRADNLGTAEALLTVVVGQDSRNLAAHYNLAVLYSAMAAAATSYKASSPVQEKAQVARQQALAVFALSHARIATSLGAVPPLSDVYWLKVSRVAGTEAGGIRPAPKPFDLAKFLQPGGAPIAVEVTRDCGSLPPDSQNWRQRCALSCGPAPGNLCADASTALQPRPELRWNPPGSGTAGVPTPSSLPGARSMERVITEDGLFP